jgi:hypothetical protein
MQWEATTDLPFTRLDRRHNPFLSCGHRSEQRYIKRGARPHVRDQRSFVSILTPTFPSPDRELVPAWVWRSWCVTTPIAAYPKVVPGQCQWCPEGLRSFTRTTTPTPPVAQMADDLALGHGKINVFKFWATSLPRFSSNNSLFGVALISFCHMLSTQSDW